MVITVFTFLLLLTLIVNRTLFCCKLSYISILLPYCKQDSFKFHFQFNENIRPQRRDAKYDNYTHNWNGCFIHLVGLSQSILNNNFAYINLRKLLLMIFYTIIDISL